MVQIVQAIVKSNGWTDGTGALQLFAHLDGEALNAALLMPEEERVKWESLLQGLSDYYNSPGRQAVFRWQLPTGNGSGYICHRTGNPRSAGIRRHGQACPRLDDQGQCFFGNSHLGHCGSLTCVAESFGTKAKLGCWSGPGLSGIVR